MLQIISGKFFDSENRFHNDCKGILYSNGCISGINEFEYIKIESVEAYNNISSYVVSYDNQLEVIPASMQFIKVGDDEIMRQLKNILSFSLNCVFDEDKAVVEKICKLKGSGSGRRAAPSDFIKDTLDLKRNPTAEVIEESKKFFKQMIGLKREDYINVLNCLIAYNASVRLLNEDINLAYSMLVYCLESLSQRYDVYEPIWDDYDQNKKGALEKVFSRLSEIESAEIKNILIKDEHFKLAQRFRKFIVRFLDDAYYQRKDERHIIHKDDVEIALSNAYITRSKYAHMLKPIMKQLTMEDFSKSGDTFGFGHDVFFTYSGLLRTVRTVITNFVFSLETIETEKFNWNNDLPGGFEIQAAPYFWIWKKDRQTGDGAEARLEGFVECLIYYRDHIPQMDDIITMYFEHLSEMREKNRHAAFALCYLYSRKIGNIEEDKKAIYEQFIKKHESLLNECCIHNLLLTVMQVSLPNAITWETEECEKIISEYNKKKYKANQIKLPPEIETMIYLMLANSCKEDANNRQKEWILKAYYNSNNSTDIQLKIAEIMDSGNDFDISYIWDRIYNCFEKKE